MPSNTSYYGIVSGRSLRARTCARSHSITSRPGYCSTPSIDRAGDCQVFVTVKYFLDTGTFAAGEE